MGVATMVLTCQVYIKGLCTLKLGRWEERGISSNIATNIHSCNRNTYQKRDAQHHCGDEYYVGVVTGMVGGVGNQDLSECQMR